MTTIETTTTESAKARTLRERAERDYNNLKGLGLTTGETFYPPGTEVQSTGVRRARAAFEALPVAEDALSELANRVQGEDRQDTAVLLGTWSKSASTDGQGLPLFTPNMFGGFVTDTGTERVRFAPTDRVTQQVMSRRPASLEGVIPASDWAAWWDRGGASEAVLRHRKLSGAKCQAYVTADREAYALVSPSYKPYDLDAAANDLLKVAPAGSRARVRYDGARARVDVILQNPYRLAGENAAAVGETHRVILRMRTADDGSGGYNLSLLAERVRCVNLTILHASKALFRGTHRSEDLRELASRALEQVEPTMAAYATQWADSWHEYYSDRYTRGAISGDEALRRIVAAGKYRIPGLGQDGTLDAVIAAWNVEPGDSKAHVHNAMTRAAHEAPTTWSSRWADDEAEEQASQLLYNRVLTLAPVEA